MDVLNQFSEKFQVPRLTISKFDNWTWSIRPVHCTLGAGILSLNRRCTSFGALTRDEAGELADVNREIETRLKAKFQPDKYNYIMLMMVDPQLHFHVVPRYSSPRSFEGVVWQDSGWPALPALGEGNEFSSSNVLEKIANALKG